MDGAPDIEILPFDPLTSPAEHWAALHAFRRVRHHESSPGEPLLSDAEYEAMEREPSRFGRRMGWMAWADGRVVGFAHTFLPDRDAPQMAVVKHHLTAGGGVRREWRRRGIGMRLLARIHDLMAENGKTVLTVTTDEPDGHAFLCGIGAEETVRHVDNRLSLAGVDWTMLEGWHTAMRAVAPDLDETVYGGRIPATEFESILPAFNAMARDIPRDRLDHPIVDTDMAMIGEWYRQLDHLKGEHHTVLLRDTRGAVAGISDLVWLPSQPDRTFQIFTGVRRDLRGLGLAKGLKASLFRHIRAALPTVRLMITGNAEVNAPMLAINSRLGYIVHKTAGTYQIGIGSLAALTSR